MSIKATFRAALAASALVATTASASYMVSGSSLQGILDDITAGGPSSINVNDDQYQPDEKWAMTASGVSSSRLIIKLAGFRVDGRRDIHKLARLFARGNNAGDVPFISDAGGKRLIALNSTGDNNRGPFSSIFFGFHLDMPNGGTAKQGQNTGDGASHMMALRGLGFLNLPGTSAQKEWTPNKFILAWKQRIGRGNNDYGVFADMVGPAAVGVPEPSTLALYSISLLGLALVAGRNFRGHKR